jgi:rsbT antagonist protein RsbS
LSRGTDSGARIPLQLAQGCVVASIQIDLDDRVLTTFREELLEFVRSSGARGVILDLSGVDVMDGADFRALRDTMRMARLMGASTVLSGLQAGVVSALIDLGVDTAGVVATATLDDAFRTMRERHATSTAGVGTSEDSSGEVPSHDPGWEAETDDPGA